MTAVDTTETRKNLSAASLARRSSRRSATRAKAGSDTTSSATTRVSRSRLAASVERAGHRGEQQEAVLARPAAGRRARCRATAARRPPRRRATSAWKTRVRSSTTYEQDGQHQPVAAGTQNVSRASRRRAAAAARRRRPARRAPASRSTARRRGRQQGVEDEDADRRPARRPAAARWRGSRWTGRRCITTPPASEQRLDDRVGGVEQPARPQPEDDDEQRRPAPRPASSNAARVAQQHRVPPGLEAGALRDPAEHRREVRRREDDAEAGERHEDEVVAAGSAPGAGSKAPSSASISPQKPARPGRPRLATAAKASSPPSRGIRS